MGDLLGHAALTAAVAAGIAALFRALPWPKSWLERKPWACSACLGGWGALAAVVLVVGWPGLRMLVILWLAATPIAAMVVRYLFPPPISFDGEDEILR